MLTTNLILVFAIGSVLALLTLLQFFLATQHDHVTAAAGPIARLEVLDVQVKERKALMLSLDEELSQRREDMKNLAGIQAEAEEVSRRRDELLAEWNSLEMRREEVRAVRAETEAAVTDNHNANAELARNYSELEEVKERLEKAERLLHQIDALTAEQKMLTEKLESMRQEAKDLEDAKAQVLSLRQRALELESKAARLQGQVDAQVGQLQETQDRLSAERVNLHETEAEHGRLTADFAVLSHEVEQKRRTLVEMDEQRTTLEARRAYLEGRNKELDGQIGAGGGTGATKDDPLRELKSEPPVLTALKNWKDADVVFEKDALHRVEERLRNSGLDYSQRVVRAFHTSMKVNETSQMTVLAGISGTGKSQLPRVYAAGMGIGFLQVPVQPRWDSPQDLMGFYNYIEGRFRPTDMAKAMWQLDEHNNPNAELHDRMMMILLDEMNLARVEYYFSDFLSRLESRPSADSVAKKSLRKDAEIELEIPSTSGFEAPRIFPGYNLLFAGTMNEDESTQSLSDKVVDRANVMRFAAPKKIKRSGLTGVIAEPEALSRQRWQKWIKPVSAVEAEAKVTDCIDIMVEIMRGFGRPFGHRLGRAIMAYVANYPEVEGANRIDEALSDQVEMRLLPKLRGVDVDIADPVFAELERFVSERLHDDTLTSAIKDSVTASKDRGQFVWHGVIR